MSHKTMVRVAIIMIIVFGTIVIVYPRLFGPSSDAPGEPAAIPAVQ